MAFLVIVSGSAAIADRSTSDVQGEQFGDLEESILIAAAALPKQYDGSGQFAPGVVIARAQAPIEATLPRRSLGSDAR
jgi:hypothetical protein